MVNPKRRTRVVIHRTGITSSEVIAVSIGTAFYQLALAFGTLALAVSPNVQFSVNTVSLLIYILLAVFVPAGLCLFVYRHE